MNKTINCRKFAEQLNAYLDNELDQRARFYMDEHAKYCPECAEKLDDMTRILTWCAELDEGLQLPLESQAAWRRAVRIESANRQRRGASGWVRAMSTVAAALLLLIGGTAIYRNMQLSPETREPYSLPLVELAASNAEKLAMATYPEVGRGTTVIESDGNAEVDESVETGSFGGAADDSAALIPPMPVDGFDPDVAEADRKVIRSANRDIESSNFDEDLRKIEELVDEYEGRIVDRNFYGSEEETGSTGGRSEWLSARVPAAELDNFLTALKAVGTMVSGGSYEQDISAQYYDIASRLESERAFLESLQAMIPQQTALQDSLDLKREINTVQSTIDSLTSSLKGYDKELDYSSVSISLREVADRSTVKPIDSDTLGERIRISFYDSINRFMEFAQDAAVMLVLVWPWIVIGIVVLIIVSAALRRRRNR